MPIHEISATGEAIGWLVAGVVIVLGILLVRFLRNHPHHDDPGHH